MASTLDERFAFEAEWYDPHACLIRKYQILYYATDGTVEIYDLKNRRQFLKRSKTEFGLSDLYIGSTINIHSRQFKVAAYADDFTLRSLSSKKERTLGIIKPDAFEKFNQILETIYDRGLRITKMKMCQLSRSEAGEFYIEHQAKHFYNTLIQFMSSGPVIAFELIGDNAIDNWRNMIGPTDSAIARSEAPASIRARFGTDNTQNAVHGSDSAPSATREVEFFFPTRGLSRRTTAIFKNSTLCVIKPHSVLAGQAGKIISEIRRAGFEVTAMQMFAMDRANAEEFLEIYKGVLQEYKGMVDEMCSAPCIAMELRAQNAAQAFREMAGPHDPEIARQLRPRTLRANFGKDKICNGVHCTDLPEDAQLEAMDIILIIFCKPKESLKACAQLLCAALLLEKMDASMN